jgi:tetratricopeptide (TPR) repeat protein
MAKTQQTSTALWVYKPGLDLAIGCGAWSAPLLLIGYLSANSSTAAWSIAFYGLAFVFNYPHYMATIYRAYHTREDFHKYRIFTVHITALVVLTLLLSHFWYRALPWIFTLYLCWSPWHYSGQNYGLFMMFIRRAGAKPSTNVRQALYSVFLLSYLILLVRFHTGVSTDPLFLSLGIPAKASTAMILVLGFGFVGFSAFALTQLANEVGWRPLLPSLTLYSTQFLWFLLPTTLSLVKSLHVPQTRYSTGVLAVMHSAQYLWITSYYARREANAENQGNWRPLAYFGVLFAGGIALFVPGPWLASRIFHFDFGASVLIFTALVNIHHFILDGAIWKLRDGRIAALLLNSKENLVNKATEAGNRTAAGVRWLIGDSSAARHLRTATVMLLLVWGIVDQFRYYFSLQAENLADLKKAATLNAYDSNLQSRIGRIEFQSGNDNDAVASLQQGLKLNPANASARDLLLQYLVAKHRFDEAYELTKDSLRYTPTDVNLLVNQGILADGAGHSKEAVASWQRAVELDPSQLNAHLYLADEYERQGKLTAAIVEYRAFLRFLSNAQPEDHPPAAEAISIILRLASCQKRTNQPAEAETSYLMAEQIAAETGEKSLQSLAISSSASLKAAQRNSGDALKLYQRALQIDATLNDPRTEAVDWYNYGLFLREAGFPSRLSYACLAKSEELMKPIKEAAEIKLVSAARDDLSKKDPSVAKLNQQTLQQALDEALHLQTK